MKAQPKHMMTLLLQSSLNRIYEASLTILQNTGMRIADDRFLGALAEKGAEVHYGTKVVKFPENLLRETTAQIARESEAACENPPDDSGNARPKWGWGGGPALYYLDCDQGQIREGTAQDALTIIHLADALPEISNVSSTMLNYSADLDGSPFPPQLYTLKSTALTAKNTPKVAYAENIYTVKELKYLIEVGLVVHDGNMASLKRQPTFSECKAVISPLRLEPDAADILYYLAQNEFRCLVASMPIAGATAPITLAGVVAQANAEVLGAWTAIKAVNPRTPCGHVTFLGVMDMRESALVYGVPEALLMNVAFEQLSSCFYRTTPVVQSLYIDAKLPNYQSAFERGLSYFCQSAFGNNYGATFGFGNRSQILCGELALMDLELTRWIDRYQQGFRIDEQTLAVDIIDSVGIGGSFLAADHTAKNFRREHWISALFDRGSSPEVCLGSFMTNDMLKQAGRELKKILKQHQPYQLDHYKAQEIDHIVKQAESDLVKP